ncbi:MAG: Re/Si-specific NAD(P)(+) transhydrogenase subunit alpha [Chloroflexia bacterium]|nr:Re/Si-specific NAD(P)(+) transhydrogenase subunit alpha [Chloroflexia bacterium]
MADPAPGGSRPAGVTIGIPREIVAGEHRVSMIPDAVGRLVKRGNPVFVQQDAGAAAFFLDDQYTAAGAQIVPDAKTLYERADLILKIHRPQETGENGNELDLLRQGQSLVAFLQPLFNPDLVQALAEKGVTAFSMDAVPRTSRAQYMDALSSMSNLAGYKAVIMAAERLPKFFPLLMTAAGTIAPAKVLIIGAGVAGLQAIGTARRLGAVVEAYDARPVVKEQVESLGAKFVEIDIGQSDTQTAGGYAKEMTADEIRRQQEGLAARAAANDVVITTALVPGRPAPRLITEDAVRRMRPGSIVVDLAGETGGNCELTVPGETVERHHVVIMSPLNLPATMPVHASQMYAKNLQNLLDLFITKDGAFNLNMDDDNVAATCITHDGEILHAQTRAKLGLSDLHPPAAPEPAPEPDASEAAATTTDAVPTSSAVTAGASAASISAPAEQAEFGRATTDTDDRDLPDIDDGGEPPDWSDTAAELDAEADESLEWAPDVEERAASDAAGFVPPISLGDTLPASREMLDQAVRDIDDEIASHDADLPDEPPTDQNPWRPRNP